MERITVQGLSVAKIKFILKPVNYSEYCTAMLLFILRPSASDTLQPGRQLPLYRTNALTLLLW